MKRNAQLIRYWHPRKGGWYHAILIRKGYKWAVVRELAADKKHRVSISDVQEVTA